MKRILLALVVIATTLSASAQTWEWGTATWNIEDGKVFESIDDLNANGVMLTFPNPTNYALTFFNMVAISYDLYVDDNATPTHERASAQMSAAIALDYHFVEGHSYRVVTTGAALAFANLATYTTDTLSTTTDSYTISFSIKGPELVKTIEVEGTMALTIVDQNYDPTYSLIDAQDICNALGIGAISEAEVYGLNVNGSYNPYYIDPFDGWRDADGEYTNWSGNAGGGVYAILGHNPYPAVYCVKLNETADSVFYYFYDYWRDYDPDEPDVVPVVQSKRRVPETSYHNVIWDWDNGDGTITQYRRSYRADEGTDYYASFIVKANKKSVVIRATLHFVSQEAYAAYLAAAVKDVKNTPTQERPAAIYSPNGVRQSTLQKGFNIVRSSDGTTRKLWVK